MLSLEINWNQCFSIVFWLLGIVFFLWKMVLKFPTNSSIYAKMIHSNVLCNILKQRQHQHKEFNIADEGWMMKWS